MRLIHSLLALVSSIALSGTLAQVALADPLDPAAARELLKQGYALKQEGKYADALDRLLESLRLDSQVKTLINIADCEEKLGQLSQAQRHWVLARDQASLQSAQELQAEAQRRLTSLEDRMPRLTINLGGTPVVGQEVRRDGVLLSHATLGTSLPTDPGHHVVVVSAPGHQDAQYAIDVVEHDSKVLEVTIGAASGQQTRAQPAQPQASPATPQLPPDRPDPSTSENRAGSNAPTTTEDRTSTRFWSPARIGAVTLAGAGVVAFGVAGFEWAHANSLHREALGSCNPNCDGDAREKQTSAISSVHLTTAMIVTGSVLVAAGATVWLAIPSTSSKVALTPALDPRGLGLAAAGRF